MNLFSSFFGQAPNKRTQLMFYDDGSFDFVERDIDDTFLIEKKNGDIVKAYRHFYINQFAYAGHPNSPPAHVTLSFERDVVFDLFNVIPDSEKPWVPKDTRRNGHSQPLMGANREWLANVGHARRLKLLANQSNNGPSNKIINTLIGLDIVGAVAVLLGIGLSRIG